MKRICMGLLAVVILLGIGAAQVLAGETKMGGEVHANWLLHLNNQGLQKNFNSFNLSRARVAVEHKFDEKYQAELVIEALDRTWMLDEMAGTDWGSYDIKVRRAYLQGNKLLPYTDVRFGMHDLLWIEKVDRLWGLRFVDEVSLHKLGYLPEADLGVSLIGMCPGSWGVLAVQAMNGSGYMSGEANKNKNFAIYGELIPFPKSPDWSEVSIMGQIYEGWPNIADGSGGASFSDNTMMDRMQVGMTFKYRKWVTAFGEYFVAKDDADWTNNVDDEFVDEANGFTLLGRLYVATSEKWLSRVSLFGKYEWVDKNRNATGSLDQENGDARFLTAGVSYTPTEGAEVAFAVKRNTVSEIENNIRIEEVESNSISISIRALLR